jgi:hypothetical protein
VRKFFKRAGMAVLVLLVVFIVIGRIAHPAADGKAAIEPATTCFITGGGELRVCHAAADEGQFYKPKDWQVAYNTQIIALAGGRYATVLHSEAEDTAHFMKIYGHVRAGDSIKTGIGDTPFSAPADLDYRVWGSLNNVKSPLYYAYDPEQNPAAKGLSGGGNPMVVRDGAYFYMFYLGVMSDGSQGIKWRNVLLEARTADFLHFDLLQDDVAGKPVWVAFAGENAMPALVRDVDGKPLVSNQPAVEQDGTSKSPGRQKGSVPTAGLFGSVIHLGGLYYYFYSDEDAQNPEQNHLYLRTSADIGTNGTWSAPKIVMDLPPEIMIRVSKAPGMDRWAVLYMCLRSLTPFVSDVCLQYTSNMNLSGPGSLGALQLFDGPVYHGVSAYALGLVGADKRYLAGKFLKIQPYYLTGEDGSFALPPPRAGAPADVGGLVTWNDLPKTIKIFGAATDWGEWTVTKVGP